jgi:polysaccharide deacetylase 2 family uncharacterized protein YibQ
MSPSRIRDLLDEDLDEVPEAVGVNNHMGSAFTESAPSLAPVLAVLRERGLFFLDSMTSPASRGDEMARAVGIPFIRRDVFLDNDRNVRAILAQLDKAERAAAKNGQAVAIGHPYPETLEALTRWSRRPGRVQVVPLTALSIRR